MDHFDIYSYICGNKMWSISLLQSWWRMLRNISISHWKTSKRINIKYENRTTQLKVRDLKYECITSCGDISLKYKNDSTTNTWKHSQLTIFNLFCIVTWCFLLIRTTQIQPPRQQLIPELHKYTEYKGKACLVVGLTSVCTITKVAKSINITASINLNFVESCKKPNSNPKLSNMQLVFYCLEIWLTDCYLTSSEQYFNYIHSCAIVMAYDHLFLISIGSVFHVHTLAVLTGCSHW